MAFAPRLDSPEIFDRVRLSPVILERCSTWNARALEFSSDFAAKTRAEGVFAEFTRKSARGGPDARCKRVARGPRCGGSGAAP
ncbi:MAG: hypothetical protein RLP09_04835, partial [Sandaracinaceae bacterium]